MAAVKVWNDNVHDFAQEFKEHKIKIPAKQFIEMEEYEAHDFLGYYHPMKPTADGGQCPTSYKMLRIEKLPKKDGGSLPDPEPSIICQACGFKAHSKWELNGHSAEMHSDQIVDEAEHEKKRAGRPKKTQLEI